MIQTSGTERSGKRSRLPLIAAIVAGVLLIVGIRYVTTRGDAPAAADPAAPGTTAPPARDGCNTVHIAASSEKAARFASPVVLCSATSRPAATSHNFNRCSCSSVVI